MGQLFLLSSSSVVLVPLMSRTLMVRVMVGEHEEGEVWGKCGVAGGVDGEVVVSGCWGVTFVGRTGGGGGGAVDDRWCGPHSRRWWRCDRCCGREGGVGDGGVPRVVYWLLVVELFFVCG